MFWLIVCKVARESPINKGRERSGSPKRTTSPDSATTSIPEGPPTARPTLERARAGASLIPSPTIATRCVEDISAIIFSLSAGSKPPWHSSIPRYFATWSATIGRSPERRAMRSIPISRSLEITPAASGRMRSRAPNNAWTFPSIEATITVWPVVSKLLIASSTDSGMVILRSRKSLGVPTRMFLPSSEASTPNPGRALKSEVCERVSPLVFAEWTRSFAKGCSLDCSTLATRRSASSALKPSSANQVCPSSNLPSVRVPVLSKAKALICASCSSEFPPLIKMPVPASLPIAAIIAAGVARISAQGHATTRMERAG